MGLSVATDWKDAMNPKLAENQHYPDVDAHSTGVALLAALRQWQKAACDCCSPTVLDAAIDSLGYDVELWEAFRRFGIELAYTAQSVLDTEAEGRA